MNRNPWSSLPTPQEASYFKTIPVRAGLNPHGLPIMWALDYKGRKSLYVEYPKGKSKPIRLPSLRSLAVHDFDLRDGRRAFTVTLNRADAGDIFFEICVDLIGVLQDANPLETPATLILRLERWSDLLRRGTDTLSDTQQRGLLAELYFLHHMAIPTVGEQQAIQGWTGPLDAPQDFQFGQTFIEVKSKWGGGSNAVTISSESQLSTNETEKLFLFVLEINQANGSGGITLSEYAQVLRNSMASPIAVSMLASKLSQAGFDFTTKYDSRWSLGQEACYNVRDKFPRIVNVMLGVSQVSYKLDLNLCTDYQCDVLAALNAIRGSNAH